VTTTGRGVEVLRPVHRVILIIMGQSRVTGQGRSFQKQSRRQLLERPETEHHCRNGWHRL